MPAKNNKKPKPVDTSWRRIQQGSTRRPASGIARRRKRRINYRWLGGGMAVCLLLGTIVVSGWYLLRAGSDVEWAGHSEPLRKVYFETDGVLDDPWLQQRLNLPRGISLMAVDIFAVQADLLAEGQTRSVEVERVFPDALRVGIREHQPVLRLAAREASGERRIFLVAEDGQVFVGKNYAAATLRGMPYLDGVVLRRSGEGRFQRLQAVPVVADLLAEARQIYPAIFSQWTVVDCRDFSGDVHAPGALIRVRTRDYGEWIFAPHDFGRQLDRLETILAHVREQNLRDIQTIDLSFEEPVLATASAAANTPRRASAIRR